MILNIAYVLMNDGRRKKLKYLEIGDKVKSLDEKGRLIDTIIIMIMDISNQTSIIILCNNDNNN